MNDEPQEPATIITPPKKRTGWPKGKPRPRKAQKSAALKPSDELAGIDAYKCCDGCNAERCIITETPFCAHPFKSPLQAYFLGNPKVVARYNKAKAYLANQRVDIGRL